MEKYGFIYIWFNGWKKKFYIGCHWGTETDGYISSSKLMKRAYTRNPEYFKRRVVQRIYTNRQDLLEAEFKWLSLIPDEELGKRYYNLSKKHFGHWSSLPESEQLTIKQKLSKAHTGKKYPERALRQTGVKRKPFTDETRKKMSDARKGIVFSEDHKKNLSIAGSGERHRCFGKPAHNRGLKHTDDHRQKISEGVNKAFADGSVGKKISEKLTGRKLDPEHAKKLGTSKIGRKWISDGINNLLLGAGKSCPEGWRFGLSRNA